jgi:hypothetical protein
MEPTMQCFQNALTYFAAAVSYVHEMLMKSTPVHPPDVCLGTLDGLLHLPLGGAQALLVLTLKTHELS